MIEKTQEKIVFTTGELGLLIACAIVVCWLLGFVIGYDIGKDIGHDIFGKKG